MSNWIGTINPNEAGQSTSTGRDKYEAGSPFNMIGDAVGILAAAATGNVPGAILGGLKAMGDLSGEGQGSRLAQAAAGPLADWWTKKGSGAPASPGVAPPKVPSPPTMDSNTAYPLETEGP